MEPLANKQDPAFLESEIIERYLMNNCGIDQEVVAYLLDNGFDSVENLKFVTEDTLVQLGILDKEFSMSLLHELSNMIEKFELIKEDFKHLIQEAKEKSSPQ